MGPVIEAAEMGEVPPLVIPGGETSPGVKDREKKMSRRGCVRCLREVWVGVRHLAFVTQRPSGGIRESLCSGLEPSQARLPQKGEEGRVLLGMDR